MPTDDGDADHLFGLTLPPLALPSTDGGEERVDKVPQGYERRVVFVFPRTGRPGEQPLVPEWDEIPGARGCTPEACGFRDHWNELRRAGAYVVGLSTQDTDYQREAVARLRLPFPLLSDAQGHCRAALRLPSFEIAGLTLLKRLTLVITGG
ncbi:MAG TPA: peroxiredoxin, partial [Actinomycetota bacterium]|nr:peroxiredoxin [Actinomycetota bacterium]